MSKLEEALEECLDRLARGEATLEECLARYPKYAGELRRLLAVVNRLERGQVVQPAPRFRAQGRAQLLAYMQTHPRGWGRVSRWLGPAFSYTFRLAFSLIIIMVFFLGTGTALAQAALPGDTLYDWKLASERVWRAVHVNPLATDLLLSGRRVSELIQVADDPQIEPLARQNYEQFLDQLTQYRTAEAQELIFQTLSEQKAELNEADLTVPELDEFLTKITAQGAQLRLDYQVAAPASGHLTYTLTLTNHGSEAATAQVVSTLADAEEFVAASEAGCVASAAGEVTCTLDNLVKDTPHQITLTTVVSPCFAGSITNTVTLTGSASFVNSNPPTSVVAVSQVELPFPRPAQVLYVQSQDQAHTLGWVTSAGRLISGEVHLRAAAPAWSPDGSKVAFFGEEGISELGGIYSQGNGLWLAELVGTEMQQVSLLVAQDHIKNITWSLDGSKLAFEVGPPNFGHEVVVVDARDGQQISRFPGEQPAWSPDSQQLAIRKCDPGCGIWRINFDGGQGEQITVGETDSYPTWSAAGQYLAFASRRDDNWEIYRLDLTDGQLLRLTDRPGTDTTPVFDACGREIYLRTDHYGSWWITVMQLDGSAERKVKEGVGSSDDWGLARPVIR